MLRIGFGLIFVPALAVWGAAPVWAQQPSAQRLFRPVVHADSSAPRPSWSGTGAVVGAVGGGAVFAAAFYHFTHRSGAVNNTTGTLGGTLVGTAIGAVGGALFGALVGSLIPRKHD